MALNKNTILIADDHVIIRRGIKFLVENNFGRANYIEVANLSGIKEKLEKHPDISYMLLDMQLMDGNLLEILPELKKQYPHIPIMVFSMVNEDIYGKRLLKNGVDYFISKQLPEEEIIKALDALFSGKKLVSAHSLRANDAQAPTDNPLTQLSEREIIVMEHLLKGDSVKSIAGLLDLKTSTVATYKARIFEKLDINNLIDLKNIAELYQKPPH